MSYDDEDDSKAEVQAAQELLAEGLAGRTPRAAPIAVTGGSTGTSRRGTRS